MSDSHQPAKHADPPPAEPAGLGSNAPAPKGLVWDFPMRILHWGFAASFCGAWYIANFYDPEGDIFKYHMLLGILSGFFVAARIALGLFGSRYARWSRFFFSPLHTARYLFDAVRFRSAKYPGINPGTSWVALAMYAVAAALIYTGFSPDYVEVWHVRLAGALPWLVGLHLAGLLLHTLSHREWIALAMITGQKSAVEGLRRENWLGGWILLVLMAATAAVLYYFFDINESTLKLPGLPSVCLPIVQKG